MIHRFFSLPLALIIFYAAASAVEIDTGFGLFNSKAVGTIEYQTDFFKGSSATLDNDAQYHIYIWGDIDSKIDYVPKLRLEYTRIRSSGRSAVSIVTENELINEFLDRIGGNQFELSSVLTHNMYDAFIYYEFFEDSSFPAISIGGGVKDFDYDYDVDIYSGVQFNDTGGATVPMLYGAVYKELDKLIALEADTRYYAFGDSDMYDIRAKMEVAFELNAKIDAGLEVGYRYTYFHVKGDDVENVGGNMKYSGIFFGFISRFR